MKRLFVHCKSETKDGHYYSYSTYEVEYKETLLPRKGQTLSGYGKALPTQYMVKWQGKWRRVKVVCFSNCGTAYIGNKYSPCLTVSIDE